MALADLLDRLTAERFETPETPATRAGVSRKPAPILACTQETPETPGNCDTRKICREARTWWLVRFEDGTTSQVACSPPSTRDEVLLRHTGAVAAEPFTPAIRAPEREMMPDEEQAIRRWCQAVGEADPEVVAGVLEECRRDASAREYYLKRSGEIAETLTICGFDDWLDASEHFAERAAIAEFDGRLTRHEAEALAWRELLAWHIRRAH